MKMMKKTMVRAGSLALLTLCASCDRSGKVTREPAARLTREAQNVIDNLMALQRATPRRYVVSWTHPWPEYGSACSKRDASGKWVPKALDEIRLDGYVHGRTGKDPILYFTDFYCGLGTWLGQDEYARNLANMEGFIKKAYDNWRSVPVFSWHLGNPYSLHRKDLPKLSKGEDYRYRYSCEGYPQEHRYVIREILEGTGTRCGEGRADAKDAGDLPAFANPRAWYDWHLDRICEFLKRLVDRDGKPIPAVVRLFHECEDDWQWWGKGSVERDDYVRIFRYTVTEIRKRSGLKSLLFMYSPDRFWQTCENRDAKDDFLYRYPGDDVVDIIGFDDYSLGGVPKKWTGDQASGIRASLAETVRKARLVSAFSLAHGKPAGIVETSAGSAGDTITGLEMKLKHGYGILREIMNSDGVAFAFFNTWGGNCTVPGTDAGKAAWKAYLDLPETLVVGKGVDLTADPARTSAKVKKTGTITTLAARSEDGRKAALLLTDYRGTDQVIEVAVNGGDGEIENVTHVSAIVLDDTRDNFPCEVSWRDGRLTLVKPDKNSAAFLITAE